MNKTQMTRSRVALIGSSAMALALMAAPAHAQSNFEDEIIVTATKRATTLQDTPVAVTVTTAEVIEKARILDLKDLQSVVPTLRVSQLQNAANTSLSIRGFANGANNIGIEPSVGLFIDGVYRSRAASQIGDLPRLDRIEVLSGPQSTLFGKNASAGVVSIATAKPSYETTGFVEGGVGNYGLFTGKAYVSSALSENAAFSLGGGFQSRNGYAEITPTGEDLNELDRFNLRGQMLWEPTDALSFRFIGDYSQLDENCCIVATDVFGPTVGAINLLGGDVSSNEDSFTYETPLNRNTPNKVKDRGFSLQGDYDMDFATLTSITAFRRTDSGFAESDSDFSSISILGNVSQDLSIDTFTQELRLTSNPGDLPFDWMIGGYYFDEDIREIAGASYGPDARNYVNVLLAGLTGGTASLPLVEASIPGLALGASYANGQGSREQFNQADEAFSIFGTVDYHVTDRLTLTGGLNYTKDKKDVTGRTLNTDAFSARDLSGPDGAALRAGLAAQIFANGQAPLEVFPSGLPSFVDQFAALSAAPGFGNNQPFIDALANGSFGAAAQAGFLQYQGGVNQLAAGLAAGTAGVQFFTPFLDFPNVIEDGRTNDDDLTWTVKAAYEVNDNVNVFASAATGFKSSSWAISRNSRPFAADLPQIVSAGIAPANLSAGTRFAGPEETTVYELGLKTRFEKGAFNLTVFDQTIEGFQSTIFAGTAFVLNNAGEQSVRGAEFDVVFKPIDSLAFNLGGAYLDAKYDDFRNAGVLEGSAIDLADGVEDSVGDLSGQTPAGIPEISLSFAATYSFDISDTIEGYVRGDFQYEDETGIVDNLPDSVTREVNSINLSAGMDFDNGLSLQAWVRNLTNDEYFTSGFPAPAQAGTFNYYPNQPRTYGLVLRKEF